MRNLLSAAAPAVLLAWSLAAETALDHYVAAPDPSYRYSLTLTRPFDEHTEHLIALTSQTWRRAGEVDRTEWKHWLTLYVPKRVSTSTGLLFIAGGDNDGSTPKSSERLRQIAVDTSSVVAELRMVPNQPLRFPGDTEGRFEDAAIAYTWDKFLNGGDDRWPMRLPMTKSAVRAMDTVTAFCGSVAGGRLSVDRFVVAGASKRGWTTWTTAAVDKRVAGIIPIVIDALNVEASFHHHYRSLGFWAPAVADYDSAGIMDWFGTEEMRRLMEIEDPFTYRERFTMPKLMINSAGDQFFLVDSSRFYFDRLPGEKYLRYVPNTDHGLDKSDAWETVYAFYAALLQGRERPEFAWTFTPSGIRVTSKRQPSVVRLWQAVNPRARDFRLESIGAAWKSSALRPGKDGAWQANVPAPRRGWSASFVELEYPSGGRFPLKFTTAVRVAPDTLPHPAPPRIRAGRTAR